MKKSVYWIFLGCLLSGVTYPLQAEEPTLEPVSNQTVAIQPSAAKQQLDAKYFEPLLFTTLKQSQIGAIIDHRYYPLFQIEDANYISFTALEQLGFTIKKTEKEIIIEKSPSPILPDAYSEQPIGDERVGFTQQSVRLGNLKTYAMQGMNDSYLSIRVLIEYFDMEQHGSICYLNQKQVVSSDYVRIEGGKVHNTSTYTMKLGLTHYFWNGEQIQEQGIIIEELQPGETYDITSEWGELQETSIHYSTVLHDLQIASAVEHVEVTNLELEKTKEPLVSDEAIEMIIEVEESVIDVDEEQLQKEAAEQLEESVPANAEVGGQGKIDSIDEGSPGYESIIAEAKHAFGQNDVSLFKRYQGVYHQQSEVYFSTLFPSTHVTGTMKYATAGLFEGEKVEIWNAESGRMYRVWKDGQKIVIPWNSIKVEANPPVQKQPATKEQLEAFVNKENYQSQTPYLVWTDLYRQRTYVFEKKEGKWHLIREMLCTTGNNKTPTPSGTYELQNYVAYFGVEKGYRCKDAVQIMGDYLYHSVKFNAAGTYVLGGQVLGEQGSLGCIRLSPEDSNWFYNTMPLGTKVLIR